MQKEELPGNRAYRRKKAAIERSRKPTPLLLSADWKKRKEMKQDKVLNRIDKAHERKIARQIEAGMKDKPVKKRKLTPAELRIIRRKIKRRKFTQKLTKIIYDRVIN